MNYQPSFPKYYQNTQQNLPQQNLPPPISPEYNPPQQCNPHEYHIEMHEVKKESRRNSFCTGILCASLIWGVIFIVTYKTF